jgi:serine O-acetyltransferase
MGEVRDRWRADMDIYRTGTGNACGNATLALRIVVMPRLQAVTLFRVSEWLHLAGRKNAAMVVKGLNQVVTGADITPSARIEGGLQLFHPQGVVIGPDVVIGKRARITSGVVIGKGPKRHPERPNVRAVIGDDVSIGSHAVIAGDVIFGDHVDIGAHVVVTRDIPTDGRVRPPHAIIDAGQS